MKEEDKEFQELLEHVRPLPNDSAWNEFDNAYDAGSLTQAVLTTCRWGSVPREDVRTLLPLLGQDAWREEQFLDALTGLPMKKREGWL